jgi:hypothetical protein
VVVPDAVLDDSEWDIWGAIRPLVSRAFARRLDMAVLFGQSAPTSFGPGLLARATTAAQTVDPTADAAADLLSAAEQVSITEHAPTGAAVRPGWEFTAMAARTLALAANPVGGTFPLPIAGMGITTQPPYWDATKAMAIVADWSSVLYGVRSDLTFETFSTGVVQAEDGSIATNLLQEDCTALRCVMRVGHVLATPVNGAGVAGVPVSVVGPPAP